MNLSKTMERLYGSKWAMDKKAFFSLYNTVQNLNDLRVGGLKGMLFGNPIVTQKKEESALDNTSVDNNTDTSTNNMAIINVCGIITKGPSQAEQEVLGMVDIDDICNALNQVAADPSYSCMCVVFSSPGGETCGVEELGRRIKYIDTNIKPVYGWTESQSASASYWLYSQCRTVGMTHSANVGSCGVYILVLDTTDKLEKEGIKVQSISSGKYKMMGHEFNPLSKDEKEILQKSVEAEHEKFKAVILSNRKEVNPEALEGLSYEGKEAFEYGLVDIVCDNFSTFINEITSV